MSHYGDYDDSSFLAHTSRLNIIGPMRVDTNTKTNMAQTTVYKSVTQALLLGASVIDTCVSPGYHFCFSCSR